MKLMITIYPVPRHDNGEIELHLGKEAEEIRDNENCCAFRTWLTDIDSSNPINFELWKTGKPTTEKYCFVKEFYVTTVEDFKEREYRRIIKARCGEDALYMPDCDILNKFLTDNHLQDSDEIAIIEANLGEAKSC